jgi:hypothetical protein
VLSVLKSGNLNLLELSEPVQASSGIAVPFRNRMTTHMCSYVGVTETPDNKVRRREKTQRFGAFFEMQLDACSFVGIFGLRNCTYSRHLATSSVNTFTEDDLRAKCDGSYMGCRY